MELLNKQLTRITYLANFKENTRRAGRDNITAGYLRSRVELLERYWKQFQAAHVQLLQIDDLRNNDYFTNDVYSSTELQYTRAMGYLYDKQNALAPVPQAAPPPRVEPQQNISHLPKIQLPMFSGRLAEWETFRDMFRSMIHLHPSLTNVQKLHYMKVSVTGEAKKALDGLPILDTNYATAWDLLTQRYDNQRRLATHHMANLAHASRLKNEGASELRSLLDRVTTARESLRALGLPVESWDDWMVFFASDGMDTATRKDWEKTIGNQATLPSYEEVKGFINSRIQALQASEPSGHQRTSYRSQHQVTNEASNTRRSLATSAADSCPLCSNFHQAHQCSTFTRASPSERINLARRCKLCYKCLRPGHLTPQCLSRAECEVCHKAHHTLLHLPSKRRQSEHTDAPPSKKSYKERNVNVSNSESGVNHQG